MGAHSSYLDAMRHLVGLIRAGGHVVAGARITESNGAIGLIRRDLRRWLEAGDREKS